jgi:methyl-accepting chemotaxis protein
MQKSMDEREGIRALKPAVTLMQKLPEYLNVHLGFERGDAASLDRQISAALYALDAEMKRYAAKGQQVPDLTGEWHTIKGLEKTDAQLYIKSTNLISAVTERMLAIGEKSRLMLTANMNTFYFVKQALEGMPMMASGFIAAGNILRKNFVNAEELITTWNAGVAEALAQGRRRTRYEGDARSIYFYMLAAAERDPVRINANATGMMQEGLSAILQAGVNENPRIAEKFEELLKKLEVYRSSADNWTRLYDRMGFATTLGTPCTVAECLEAISRCNTDLGQLWTEDFNVLDMLVQRNTDNASRSLIINLVIILLTLGIAGGFVLYITVDVSRSVGTLRTLFKGLNENDLTILLKVNSQDEFGELMTAFNGFLNILRSTFGSFKQSAQLVADSVFDISSSSKEITTTANEQSGSVAEIVSTMESSKNLSEQMAFKTTEVAQLAAETQELSAKGAKLRDANEDMMKDIREQNQKIISEIRNLSDMIIRISEAIRIIDSIADQTKLIAFNASLEASSSGEAGARFSVVASEIRRFADNVVESTREIRQKIEEVRGASQTLISEANNGSKQIEIGYERMSEQKIVFEDIVHNSQNVAIRSQQISNLSKQQEVASSQVFNALKEISAGAKQFVIATSATSRIADSLNSMSVELKGKVEKYRTET